jgi:polysaccharide deacetylase 2 family uncharacterized protein YibQ
MGLSKDKHKNTPVLLLFTLFIVTALIIVLLLEFIDFKKGKESFIFSKIMAVKTDQDRVNNFNTGLLKGLQQQKIPFDYFRDRGDVFHYKLDIEDRNFTQLLDLMNELANEAGGDLVLAEAQDLKGSTINLYRHVYRGEVTHLILVNRLKTIVSKLKKAKKKPKPTPPRVPRLAIIIDDVGNNPSISMNLKSLNIPITASILPDAPYARQEGERLKQFNIETMIHIPMQPKNSGSKYPRYKYVTMHSTDKDIRGLIRRAKQVVPNARGMNNHEGSLVTSSPQLMKRVLQIVKDEGLFFIDSRTTVTTVAYTLAKELKIKTSFRDVFLDSPNSYENAISGLRKLTDIALKKGHAIAIGHTFDSTIEAIRDSIPYIRSRGVQIVFASELLEE